MGYVAVGTNQCMCLWYNMKVIYLYFSFKLTQDTWLLSLTNIGNDGDLYLEDRLVFDSHIGLGYVAVGTNQRMCLWYHMKVIYLYFSFKLTQDTWLLSLTNIGNDGDL